MRLALPFVILCAALAVPGNPADGPKQADAPKQKKPKLDLRATPRMAFSPVNVLLTAELTGGDDVEEYYCPCLLYTSPSPRDRTRSRMPSSA